uniref:Uncharacterized protein n=1 Tax=viral metagenome TaxID=1070528 RepID=A0A6C0H2T6_9ZZZZ
MKQVFFFLTHNKMEKIPMKIFMGIILVIGLALIVCSFLISGSVTECNVKVQNALRGLLVMGVALFTVSATILALNCNEKFKGSASGIALIVILFLLSTITIGLISTIYQCDDTKKNNGTILNVMLIMSIFVTLGSFAYIVYQIIQRVKKGKKSSQDKELVNKFDGEYNSPSSDFGG